jgi:hypothetical protein
MYKRNIYDFFFLFLLINCLLINISLCGIRVAEPEELSNLFLNRDIEAVYGDFGDIDLGFEALASVWIMPRDETSKEDLPADYACNSLSKIKIFRDLYNYADFNIVLVDKGPCSFPQMAKEVEKIGGNMILIINDQPGPVNGYKVTNDDGRGDEVKIPVAMISYNDGKALVNYIINNPREHVYLNVEIGLNKRSKVKVDLFTNILDTETFSFLGTFKSYFDELNNYIDMNIYYLTPKIDGLLQTQKQQDCLKNGLYCMKGTTNSKNSLKKVTGVDLIYESLFHQCIFQKSKKTYFNFIEQYSALCLNSDKFSDFCGLSLFNSGMREIIMDCVFNSFGNADYTKKWEKIEEIKTHLKAVSENVNTILVDNRLKESQYSVNSYPDVYINDIKYKERLSSMHLFDAICHAFSQKPEPCKEYSIRPTNKEKEGIAWYEITLITLFIIFVNVITFYCIRRLILKRLKNRIDVDKNDLSGEINSVINSYFSLKDMENRDSSDDHPTNDLGDIQNFMEDEVKEKNPNQPKKEEPDSDLIMTNSVSLDKKDVK